MCTAISREECDRPLTFGPRVVDNSGDQSSRPKRGAQRTYLQRYRHYESAISYLYGYEPINAHLQT
jgi:hypothetical protein